MRVIEAFSQLCGKVFVACVFLGVSFNTASAADTITERSSMTEFDKTITFTSKGQTYTLSCTGTSLRRKWFIKGYAIAHYIENPVKGDQEAVLKDIFSTDKAKQVSMMWLHKLPLSLIRDGFKESLHKTLKDADYSAIEPEINKLLNFFKVDAEVGDMIVMRWLPGGYVELLINDQSMGSLVSLDLAKALWSIWLGPDAVVDRKQLIALVSTS